MRLLWLMVLLGLSLTGCMDDEDADDDDGLGGGDGDGAAGTRPRGAVTWDIMIDDNSYDPSELTIQVGDTVRWTNNGSNPHTVTGDDFDSSPDCEPPLGQLTGACMGNGDTFEYTFDEVASFDFHCKVHPSMQGTITVEETWSDTPQG